MTLPVAKSLREFLKNLIDYAGLFPPASLDLASALDEYKAYLPSADNWMLGRFIISAADLSKLPNLSDAWHFSVLGRSGKNADEFAQNLENDLNDIRSFHQHQPAFADVFEVRLPSEATPDLLKYANEKIEHWKKHNTMDVFFSQVAIQNLIPFLKNADMNFQIYSEVVKQFEAIHLKDISQNLSESQRKDFINSQSGSYAEATSQN